jgi:hypothetical protein
MTYTLRALLAAARVYRFLARKPPRKPSVDELMAMPQAEFEAWVRSTGLKVDVPVESAAPESLRDPTPAPRHA